MPLTTPRTQNNDLAGGIDSAGGPEDDRRGHVRLDAADLDWLIGARIKYDHEVRVLDLSASGIRIETDRELAPGRTLVLELSSAEGPHVVPARVVRSDVTHDAGGVHCLSACVFTRPLDVPLLLAGRRPDDLDAAIRGRAAVVSQPDATTGPQKVVVRYRDGRVVRGYTNSFHPTKPLLHLSLDPLSAATEPVPLAALKALFFVREFAGDPTLVEEKAFAGASTGRKIEVTFPDGEVLVGTTLGYRGAGTGFFLFPADDRSNNLRIFVPPGSARGVRLL